MRRKNTSNFLSFLEKEGIWTNCVWARKAQMNDALFFSWDASPLYPNSARQISVWENKRSASTYSPFTLMLSACQALFSIWLKKKLMGGMRCKTARFKAKNCWENINKRTFFACVFFCSRPRLLRFCRNNYSNHNICEKLPVLIAMITIFCFMEKPQNLRDGSKCVENSQFLVVFLKKYCRMCISTRIMRIYLFFFFGIK